MNKLLAVLFVIVFVAIIAANIALVIFMLPVALVLGLWKVHKENQRFKSQIEQAKSESNK